MANKEEQAMNTTTLGNYEVTTGQMWETQYSIAGEYHLHGKRGAHYATHRRKNAEGVAIGGYEFMCVRTGKFVRIAGNGFISQDNFNKLIAK